MTEPWGSYGVAQIGSSHWISDQESVRQLAQNYQNYRPDGTDGTAGARFEASVERHNRKAAFVELVLEFYGELRPFILEQSDETSGIDQRPVIEVTSVQRHLETWVLRGTGLLERRLLFANAHSAVDGGSSRSVPCLSANVRNDWVVALPLTCDTVELVYGEPGNLSESALRETALTLEFKHYAYR